MKTTGIFYGMDLEEYHSSKDWVSKSMLDSMTKSPMHFYALNLDPNRPAREPTAAMALGSLAHCAILEPRELSARYAVKPQMDRRTKEGKAAYEAFCAMHPTHLHASSDDMQSALGMSVSVMKNAGISQYLGNGVAEVSAFWIDQDTNVQCRCRPDWVHPYKDGVILFDLKTCASAKPEDFARSVVKWQYDKQAAFYSDGFQAASGKKVYGFVFGAVEKDFPYASAAYILSDEDVSFAREQYKHELQLYAVCKAANEWPGYPQTASVLPLPKWRNGGEIEVSYE